MTPLNDAWIQYDQEIIPADAPANQRAESRRVFYFGAQAALGILADIPETLNEEEIMSFVMDVLEGLHNELSDFRDLVKAGEA